MSAPHATSEPTSTLRTVDLLILSIGTFTLGIDGFVLSGLLPQVAASLHVSASTAGQLTTLFALVYALGSPVIAAVTSSWDRRTLLATGMTVFVAGMVVQAAGPVFPVVAAGRVLAALGAAAYQATAYSTTAILSDDEHRARSLAVVAGGGSVALVAGLPFGVLVGQLWGWRAAMWELAALAVLSVVAVRLLPPAAHAPRLNLRQRAGALTDRRVLAVLTGTVTVLTPSFVIVAYLPEIMSASGLWIVVATLGYGAGQVTGTILVSRLIRLRGPRTALLVSACGVTVTIAVLTATRTVDVAAVITIAALGLAVGLAVVPQQVRLFATVPTLAVIAVGRNGPAIYIGGALGAAVGGSALAAGHAPPPSRPPPSGCSASSSQPPSFPNGCVPAAPKRRCPVSVVSPLTTTRKGQHYENLRRQDRADHRRQQRVRARHRAPARRRGCARHHHRARPGHPRPGRRATRDERRRRPQRRRVAR